MDENWHHDHQKRDLQVSRKGVVDPCKGENWQRGKQGGLAKRTASLKVLVCVYVYICFTCVLATDECCV